MNIKRRLLLPATLLLSLLLALLPGCGDTRQPPPGTALDTFYQAILSAQSQDAEPLILFPESDPAFIDSVYPGLSGIDLLQAAFYLPPVFSAPCEIALVEAADASAAQAAADIFQARINSGAADTTYPENAAGWSRSAQVQRSGNFVCMIVLPEGFVIPENVFSLL
ncbi:MAG: DUF4358 domain-containing protein [Oscillospiraceae bacterium]|nr:DUF4358 domain-containing protein [Oscillospiraceae bacterium]